MSTVSRVISSVVFILVLNNSRAHISLTFPPARSYSLDFFDSFGSLPPCGMPKGDVKTSLISGSIFNVTWHLGYPHSGGHRIELLSSAGEILYNLTSFWEQKDPTAQSQQVILPSKFTCKDCIIRLLRQSAELMNPYYAFWSCADVDLVPMPIYVETCSGHGSNSNGVCNCHKGFWGHRCQYEDECVLNLDCGGPSQGKCVDIGGTNLPRKQCYCLAGFLGEKCARRNQIGSTSLPTPTLLTKEYLSKNYLALKLDARVRLYWRVLNETQIEFVMIARGTSYVALGWRPLDYSGDCKRFPPTVNDEVTEITILSESASHVRSKRKARRRPHPMGCTDMVIGSAKGDAYWVLDYWSVNIATPQLDSFWGGSDDIIAAGGWERNSTTTIIFRKAVKDADLSDPANDWGFTGPMHVVWARGQEHGEYVHTLPSGVDEGQSNSVPNFYTQDELKYHGFGAQRGALAVDFLEVD